MQKDTEQVILCGDSSLEDDENLQKHSRKLPVDHIQKMLQPIIKDKDVESMYSTAINCW